MSSGVNCQLYLHNLEMAPDPSYGKEESSLHNQYLWWFYPFIQYDMGSIETNYG